MATLLEDRIGSQTNVPRLSWSLSM